MYTVEDPGGAPALPPRPADARSGRPIDVERFTWTLRRRARHIALAVAIGIPLGVLVAKTLVPSEYTTQAVIAWDPPRTRVVVDPQRELKTLVDTIKLPSNLAEVRQRLSLPLTLEALARRVEVEVGRDSNLISIRGRADSPEEAVRLTDTMTQVYLESRVEADRARAEDLLRIIGGEIERVHAQLTTAREQYDRFRAENGIADLNIERQAAIEEAARLRVEMHRNRIEMESREAKSLLLRSEARREAPKVVLSETQTRAEERRLAELRAELTARTASLSGEHPEVQGLAAAVQALEVTPKDYALADRIVGTNPQWTFIQNSLVDAKAEREAAQRKWHSYAALEASVRDRVLKLTAAEGQASLMLADIQIAENRIGELKAQQKVVEGEARQPVAELRLLAPADPPSRPTRSPRRLVALSVPTLLGLLTTLAALVQALRGLRLWTPSEIAFWGRGPVVAASTWPAGDEGLDELALDLGTSLDGASGTTLLVALAPERVERAEALATRLEQVLSNRRRGEAPPREAALAVWARPDRSQALRRAARQSDRVLVLVEARAHSVFEIAGVRHLIGREDRIGFVVLGLGAELSRLPDRVGDVRGFWREPEQPPGLVRPAPKLMEC